MITIIDYGMGNLRSVQKAFEKYYSNVVVSSSQKDIIKADKIILPGVGAFKVAMDELKKRDLIEPIKGSIEKGKPFLGICLGLQLLFSESEEGSPRFAGEAGGNVKGLDIIKGKVKRFKEKDGLKIPHMGWNQIRTTTKGNPEPLGFARDKLRRGANDDQRKSREVPSGARGAGSRNERPFDCAQGRRTTILNGVVDGSYMYFVHSYYAAPEDKDVILCETDYGGNFTSGVCRDNVYGFQFHPEKSQAVGLKIVENFVDL